MNREEQLQAKVDKLEKGLGILLEALEGVLSPSQIKEVQDTINPPKKLSESQQAAQDTVLLKMYYGEPRYEKEFAHLSPKEKRFESRKVFG